MWTLCHLGLGCPATWLELYALLVSSLFPAKLMELRYAILDFPMPIIFEIIQRLVRDSSGFSFVTSAVRQFGDPVFGTCSRWGLKLVPPGQHLYKFNFPRSSVQPSIILSPKSCTPAIYSLNAQTLFWPWSGSKLFFSKREHRNLTVGYVSCSRLRPSGAKQVVFCATKTHLD